MLLIIFGFSSQDGNQSGSISLFVYQCLNNIITLPFSKETMTFIIRKCAHMSEFGLLAISLYYGLSHCINKHVYKLSLMITFLFACLDEIHQTFVPGRAGLFTDCLIDLSGAVFFLVLLYLSRRKKI